MRAIFICAVVTFLIFPGYALSRGSDSLSTVRLDNDGQHEGGRFSMEDESQLKRCSSCEQDKPLSEFGNHTRSKDGKRSQCKQCERDYRNKESTRDRQRAYRKENAETLRANQRRWEQENPEKVAEYHRRYRDEHPEVARAASQRWRENHPDRAKEAERKNDFNRRNRRAEQYAANRDKRLARNQAWKDRSREQISEYNRAYYEAHKIEHAARLAVRKAIQRGDLIKSDICNRCPAPAVIGHHHSYEPEFWLDVEWLCKKCHVRHHAEETYVDQGRADGR